MEFLKIDDLKVHFPIRGGVLNTIKDYTRAVDGVSLSLEQGKTYGLIGESGSGKTTIGKAIVGLENPTEGKILYNNQTVNTKRLRKKVGYNKDVQMIFQDVLSSLDPKKRIIDIIAEPIRNYEKLSKKEELEKILKLLNIVGMPQDSLYKYPYEFSGGQRQRIGVARAVSLNPKLIVADEPVSALDLSIQAQVLNFLKEVQRDFNLSYLFISHDLGVVKHMCDYIYIMHRGRFVETGTREDIYNNPQHIYTKRLIAAIPQISVEDRAKSRQERIMVEEEYNRREKMFYDENGRAFDLIQISKTHYVSVREKGDL
ncbi:ATP-binding cassette domain-containing protein [Clostridium algidicarnis]|uniref:ATP-binding cassette domain-containing protein n=1 Tax=Clostridium algidicarnis TaxID=37659 RepID=A0ABS6C097_9CLOT|nr:ATP-binding cassette domain-containing protein [Clostridium algidicarnis]MBU3194182.1 ATP-binding cassette domain-containing protein [Clostridium algidicarnis]MBU3195092.1 ATP-binding cassette domain-containing protein [Clostridium algidicarnis]MBU3218923.1 ATP-binding cassette domain-containing protein [Clostridium algidicarnis]MBU3229104.1 ATP-binding cassette domain-containing protein [Clostridium algidicarnis]MBU3251875.1 ATP-binding cassette domain-containing protein [Clostridium algid